MLKPNAVLSRILSLLLLPPTAATALSSVQLVKGSVAPMAAVAAPVTAIEGRDNPRNSDRFEHRDQQHSITIRSPARAKS